MVFRIINIFLAILFFTSVEAQKLSVGTYKFKKQNAVYTGELLNNKPHGKGTTKFANGDVYEGEYVKGKCEGYGIMMYANGEKYEGQ